MSQLALYSGANGMSNEQTQLDIIANDLANMNTPGYKKMRADFTDLVYQQLRAAGVDAGSGDATPIGIEVGNGSQLVGTTKIFTQGDLTSTRNDLDIAIDGDGFFEVTRADGTLAYTRAGNFKTNANSQVTTADGLLISGFQSVPDGAKIAISSNGIVTFTLPDQTTSTFQLSLVRFPNPAGLKNIGSNLLVKTPASGESTSGAPLINGYGALKQGHLEKSNVNGVEAMVRLIVAQRSFEMNSKSIQTADEMLGHVNHLKR